MYNIKKHFQKTINIVIIAFMKKLPFILASSSPRRIAMLKKQGYLIKIIKPSHDEDLCKIKDPKRLALHHSTQKASSVAKELKEGVILSADTVVVLNKTILSKPKNKADALRMLLALNNKKHKVLTAYTILLKKGNSIFILEEKIVSSTVSFIDAPKTDYIKYVNTGEPMDKAGAYAIQGLGARFVKSVEGSYSNVVGLPLFEVMQSLAKAGVVAPWK